MGLPKNKGQPDPEEGFPPNSPSSPSAAGKEAEKVRSEVGLEGEGCEGGAAPVRHPGLGHLSQVHVPPTVTSFPVCHHGGCRACLQLEDRKWTSTGSGNQCHRSVSCPRVFSHQIVYHGENTQISSQPSKSYHAINLASFTPDTGRTLTVLTALPCLS